jgi:hypothetical protein
VKKEGKALISRRPIALPSLASNMVAQTKDDKGDDDGESGREQEQGEAKQAELHTYNRPDTILTGGRTRSTTEKWS